MACRDWVGGDEARRAFTDGHRLNHPDVFADLAARGLLCVSLPEADGGAGRSFVEEGLFLEETCRTGLPVAGYSTALTATQTYLRWGSASQRKEIVTTLRGGGESIATLGPHMVNDVYLDSVRVPGDALVGTVGHGWRQITRGLSSERLVIAAMSVGAARRSLDHLIGWVTTRQQFGRPIGSLQAVRHRVADLATEIAHCRAFVYDVADRVDAGQEATLGREGSMAKLKATQVAKLAALEGVQLMGGYGYASKWGMEQQLRLAIAPAIYGGSNEVQRDIIGKSLGL